MALWSKKDRTSSPVGAEAELHEQAEPAPPPPAPPALVVPAPSATEAERWIGYIDRVDRSRIVGWCCDKEHPERSQAVEVLASNGKRIVAMASIFRQDVFDAGHKPGHFGFEVDVSSLRLKEETVIVRFADNGIAITRQPFSLDPQQALLGGDLPPAVAKAMETLAMEVRVTHADLKARGMVPGRA